MTKDKWIAFLEQIKNKFTVQDQGQYDTDIPGENIEYIEWVLGEKEMRAEFHTKPKVVGKKTFYSNRIGSTVKEQWQYDQEEKVSFAKFYEKRPNNDEWQEIELNQ